MTQQTINIGVVANDGTGDDLRVAMQKINDNFDELYVASPLTSIITIEGNTISTNSSNANLKLIANGTGVIEFEGLQIRDNHIEAIRTNDDLVLSASGTGDIVAGAIRIHGTTISSDDSTQITIGENLDVTGALTVGSFAIDSLTLNNIASADSSAIQINDSLNVSGSLSANTIDTNTIRSSDSSAVTIADNLQVNGTLTAGAITGAVFLNHGDITDGTTTVSSSVATAVDTFTLASYRSAKYFVSITDSTNSLYEIIEANVMHDGSTAYVSTYGSVTNHTASIADFTADISGSDVRLLLTPNTEASVVVKFTRVAIDA